MPASVRLAALCVVGLSVAAWGQAPASPPPASQPAASQPVLEPAAVKILQSSHALLAKATQFGFTLEEEVDEPQADGSSLERHSDIEYRVRKPDRLWGKAEGDARHGQLYYDGKSITLYDAPTNSYSTIKPAPATGADAVDKLETEYGVVLPMSSLLFISPADSPLDGLKSLRLVGTSKIDGVQCYHIAASTDDRDWQAWIQEGNVPLPRRIVVRFKTVEGAPDLAVTTKNWDLAANWPDDQFVFTAPKGAKAIDFLKPVTQPAANAPAQGAAK